MPIAINVKFALVEAAKEAIKKGPGYAQESVVLRDVAEQLEFLSLEQQQELLTCWHDLFRTGELAWGYDIDNPNAPFFHFAQKRAV